MPSRELVSVLVPAYDHGAYVGECIAALAAQTHERLELLIADDASTDDTVQRVEEAIAVHAGRFERVRFERHETNRGTAATLNSLLGHATGRYLFLNASDDRAAPHAISRLVSVLEQNPRAALAVGDSILIDEAGRRVYWAAGRATVDDPDAALYLTWVEHLRAMHRPGVFEPRLFGRAGTLHRVNYIPNGKLMRRDAVLAAGGWTPGTLEDWDLNFRLALRHRMVYVDDVLFAYRWHAGNTVRDHERMARLQAGTVSAIRRRLRDPRVWVRSLDGRDAGSRLRHWRGLLSRHR